MGCLAGCGGDLPVVKAFVPELAAALPAAMALPRLAAALPAVTWRWAGGGAGCEHWRGAGGGDTGGLPWREPGVGLEPLLLVLTETTVWPVRYPQKRMSLCPYICWSTTVDASLWPVRWQRGWLIGRPIGCHLVNQAGSRVID
jgi:hypothetical protein